MKNLLQFLIYFVTVIFPSISFADSITSEVITITALFIIALVIYSLCSIFAFVVAIRKRLFSAENKRRGAAVWEFVQNAIITAIIALILYIKYCYSTYHSLC